MLACQECLRNLCALLESVAEVVLCPDRLPLRREKNDERRSEQFLQCPPACVPLAFAELGTVVRHIAVCGNVRKVDVTDVGKGVVAIHGVDGLRKFGTACLVDAAGVGPGPFVSMGLGERQEASNFERRDIAAICGLYGVSSSRNMMRPVLTCLLRKSDTD